MTSFRSRYVRVPLTTIAAAAAAALLVLTLDRALAQSDEPAPAPIQEYRVLEPRELIFNSDLIARNFIVELGRNGWIIPDGTHIIAHTFQPGTADQITRYLVRNVGPYDETSAHLILRRQRSP